MKYVLRTVAVIALIIVGYVALLVIASETGEVVQLQTVDENGDLVTTRLWITDDAGFQYLRSSSGSSSWLAYTPEGQEVSLTRNGETARYAVAHRVDKRNVINDSMQQKYKWRNTVVLWSTGGGVNAIPVELRPID